MQQDGAILLATMALDVSKQSWLVGFSETAKSGHARRGVVVTLYVYRGWEDRVLHYETSNAFFA